MTQVVEEDVTPRQARWAIALFFFVSGFGFSTWASRIPTIQQQLHLSEAELGGVLFALPAGLMLTLPVTGWLLQRVSSRQVMLVGAILYNLALALLGLVEHTWQLVGLLFCFGSSRNLLNISMNAQSVGVQARYQQSIIASFHGVWSVAGFAAAAVGTLLIRQRVPTATHFAAVAVVLTGLALYNYRHSLVLPPAPEAKRGGFRWPDKALLKFGLIAFASMACEGTMYDWSAIYFQKAVLVPRETAALGFTVYMVAMTAGRFSGDPLANRFGVKPILHYSGVLLLAGLLLAALFPEPLLAGLGFVLVGLGVSCVIPMVFGMAGRTAALSSGSAIAAVSTVGYFGFLLVPPVVGFIAEAAGLRWSFGLMALLGGVVVLLVRRLPE
ncbi:MFS family permease [Hymenobacter luteus]|uniref:MFS family permease n=2 Tax=Hymenobacter TaxID=89966 RepID=A0A7W9SXZ1_9BACT|nr:MULTISPECIES: MFS transporter [Hymenobacter]MBB4599713.1 MFS family permease [Hymenobacter latericoloratus]MBB6057977.1 MFS family permease [Hymenobacter luteus]